MAIVLEDEHPGKVNAADGNYPQGSNRDITTSGDGTGTPRTARGQNDIQGILQKLLDVAGITPSGSPDTVLASDYFDALMTVLIRPIPTVAAMIALTDVKVGNVLRIADRDNGLFDAVLSSGVIDNGQDIIESTANPLISFVLRITSRTTVKAFGVDLTGVIAADSSSDRFITVMALSGFGKGRYPEGTYKLDATFSTSIFPGFRAFGDGKKKTIWQLDMGTTAGVQLGVDCGWDNIGTTSAAFPSNAIDDSTNYSLTSRRLDASKGCIIRDIHMSNAGGGLNAGSSVTELEVENFSFSDIRERNGQGAGYHITGATNVRARNINGLDSDRGCEIEDGAVSCSMKGGKMKNIFPDGYAGQPGGYSTSSFTLNAHAHIGTNGVKLITYEDMEVENCLLSIDCQRSSPSINVADLPQKCSWKNIRIISPRTSAAVPNPIFIEGIGNTLDNIILEGTAIDAAFGPLIKVFGSDSRDNVLKNFEIGQKYNGTLALIEASHTTLERFGIEDQTGTPAVEDLISISGTNVTCKKLNFVTPESARTFIRYVGGADDGTIIDCDFEHPGANDVTVAAVGCEADRLIITDSHFKSSASGIGAKFESGSTGCVVSENAFNYGGASNVVRFQPGSSGNIASDNTTNADNVTFQDLGLNRLHDNMYGAQKDLIQVLTDTGVVTSTDATTEWVTTGVATATLANGYKGQVKFISMETFVGIGTLTPANLRGGTTITFNAVGESVQLMFQNGSWTMMGGTATLA